MLRIEFKRLVTFMSQKCDCSSVGQVFAIDLDYAIVHFSGSDKHGGILAACGNDWTVGFTSGSVHVDSHTNERRYRVVRYALVGNQDV